MAPAHKNPKCKLCGTEDPTAFHKGRKNQCKQCQKPLRQARYLQALDELELLNQTKVCAGCHQEKATTQFSPQKSNCKTCSAKQDRARRQQNYTRSMWQNAKYRASQKGLEFTITEADIQIPDTCPVLGIPLNVSNVGRQYNSPSLDRIDNSKGYTPSNIQVISWRANHIKNDSSPKELRRILAYMEGLLLFPEEKPH